MVTEKLAAILSSRTDLTKEQIGRISEVDGWRIVYELDREKTAARQQAKLPEVCFTGFNKTDKARLAELATAAGFDVKDAVTKDLVLLIAGENAGPSKLKKAEAQSCPVTDEQGLIRILEERHAG